LSGLILKIGLQFTNLNIHEKLEFKTLRSTDFYSERILALEILRELRWEFINYYSEGMSSDIENKIMINSIDDYKRKLSDWAADPQAITPATLGKWHIGNTYNQLPNKLELRKEGFSGIAKGWLPNAPIISPNTSVLAVGSCFASHFTMWLADNGFNQKFPDSPYNALLRFGSHFESPAVIAQQFRWAFDELDPTTLLWIDKNRHLVDATDEGKQAVLATLEQADVLILTLGLSEVWYDKISGEPLWRALTEETFDPERHVFRVESMAQTLRWLETIEQLRRKRLPNLKIIFTISPIPLKTTFRPVSAITANAVSKAILRAALDEFLRNHEAILNKQLFYFPSYEMVTSFFLDPFLEDNRHLAPIVPGSIIAFFAKYFCEPSLIQRNVGSLSNIPGGEMQEHVMRHAAAGNEGAQPRELLVRIAELEDEKITLQKICDERQHVINGLEQAADERLELIRRLDKELRDRM
jgi:hypothetical protein